jgi:2-(1,2-epoxy-1,2-dihydrophenyl)acetyl-CoA isomerase
MAQRDGGAPAAAPSPGAEFEAYEDASRQLYWWHEEVVRRVYRFPKPVIALVNGAAAGAGLGLAGACDIRLASDRAVFTTAFARIGRSGDFGTSFFVRQLVGPAKLRELYFTADRIDAEEALLLGLVNHVYPHDELMSRGLEFAERVAAGPVRAFARMKEAFLAADAGDLDRVLAIEAKNMPLSRGAEGRAFLQRFLERQ